MPTAATLISDLKPLLSSAALVTDPAALPEFGRDFWESRGVPGAVVRAAHTDDVAATLRFAAERGIPIAPRAAGTNVGGGFLAPPNGIILDMRLMNRVLDIDAEQRTAVVEPGVLNGDLQQRLAPLGLCWSPDPASALISTVGGNIVENAGGPHALKYGNTYHHVEAVTCVLPGGDTLRLSAHDRGPDLLGVLIGSEGTLAVVVEADLWLRPLPAVTRTLLAAFERVEGAVEAVSATIAAGVVPAAMEFFDQTSARIFEQHAPSGYPTDASAVLLVDLDGDPDKVARDLAALESVFRDAAPLVRVARDDAERTALWRGRLLAGQALAAGGMGFYICDVTVPRECLPESQRRVAAIGARHGLRFANLGHAGDGNIHPVILYDPADPKQAAALHAADDEVVAMALELGGTLTGEHGVGSSKREQMRRRFSPAELAAMRAVKSAFDPSGILNPGILLPDHLPNEPPLPKFAMKIDRTVADRRAGRPWSPAASPRRDTPNRHARPSIDAANLTVTASAHLRLSTLAEFLVAEDLLPSLPVREGGARTVGSLIGGYLNDGTDRTAVRGTLLAVRALLPDVRAVRFGSNTVKDVAGYDLKRLFIGSGEAFGLIREATLRVTPTKGNDVQRTT